MRCPMKSFLLKIAVGIEQISGVGLEDTFSLRWRAVRSIINMYDNEIVSFAFMRSSTTRPCFCTGNASRFYVR